MTSDPLRSPLPGDPEAVHRWLEESNPELYRQLALYLQVLRQVLAPSVDQACFHLATQLHPSRYAALPLQRRQKLHRRLSELVHRCASLLTVEQLATLAAQIANERQRQRRERQRTLLQRLTGETTAGEQPGSLDPGTTIEATDPEGLNLGPGPLPPGSVQLGLDLPLRADLLGWAQVAANPFLEDSSGAERFDPDGQDPSDSDLEGPFDDELAAELASGLLGDLDLDLILDPGDPLQPSDQGAHFNEAEPSFFAEPDEDSQPSSPHRAEDQPDPAAGSPGFGSDEAMVPWSFLNAAGPVGGVDRGGPALEAPQDNAGASLGADPYPWGHSTPEEGLLPRNPLALQAWLEGYDRALARRLRNLSHALNVELLRSGLISALLPTSLLDAVLDGRIDPQGAPPNLLQLQLPMPMPMPGLESPLQATVLLLRCGDLELEQPRLRTVRRELQRRRQEGRRMAQHYRRLQRRLQGREAEALWLQDIRTRQQGPAPSAEQP